LSSGVKMKMSLRHPALAPLRVRDGHRFDDRMAELRERLRQTQEEGNAAAHDMHTIHKAAGHLIPDEMLSGRAGETGVLLRKALAREERLARELELAKATAARALEREHETMYVRMRQQQIHSTLLTAAHDAADESSESAQAENALLRRKVDALEARVKELMIRGQEDEQLMRWDLELARRERDAARMHLEQSMGRARAAALEELQQASIDEEHRRSADERSDESRAHEGWDFAGLLPEGAELKLMRASVRQMRETLTHRPAPDDEDWRQRFGAQLTRVEAALGELEGRR
jgi:hypothetical protein